VTGQAAVAAIMVHSRTLRQL